MSLMSREEAKRSAILSVHRKWATCISLCSAGWEPDTVDLGKLKTGLRLPRVFQTSFDYTSGPQSKPCCLYVCGFRLSYHMLNQIHKSSDLV